MSKNIGGIMLSENKSRQANFSEQKQIVESLKSEWNLMWSERFNDRPKAESISVDDYTYIGIERGTVIEATRDFKPLNFKEILQQHNVEKPDRFIQPDPSVGGWGKFIKKEILKQEPNSKQTMADLKVVKKKSAKQQSSRGSGWLKVT